MRAGEVATLKTTVRNLAAVLKHMVWVFGTSSFQGITKPTGTHAHPCCSRLPNLSSQHQTLKSPRMLLFSAKKKDAWQGRNAGGGVSYKDLFTKIHYFICDQPLTINKKSWHFEINNRYKWEVSHYFFFSFIVLNWSQNKGNFHSPITPNFKSNIGLFHLLKISVFKLINWKFPVWTGKFQ